MEEGAETEEAKPDKPDAGAKKGMSVDKQALILFAVLMLVFASFLVSYYYFKPSTSFKYGDFTVHKTKLEGTTVDFYLIPLKIGNNEPFNLMLRKDPREIENITFEVNGSFWGGMKGIWITTDANYTSDATIASGEIGRFVKGIGLRSDYALTSKIGDYPEITCSNATKEIRVVDLRLGNETRVYEQDNCLIVEGADYDGMVKAADKLVMGWLERLYLGSK